MHREEKQQQEDMSTQSSARIMVNLLTESEALLLLYRDRLTFLTNLHKASQDLLGGLVTVSTQRPVGLHVDFILDGLYGCVGLVMQGFMFTSFQFKAVGIFSTQYTVCMYIYV